MSRNPSGLCSGLIPRCTLVLSLLAIPILTAAAQETGTVAGTVTRV